RNSLAGRRDRSRWPDLFWPCLALPVQAAASCRNCLFRISGRKGGIAMRHEEKLALAAQIRQEVLGTRHVSAPGKDPSNFQKAFQEFTVEHCWANVWTRPGLDRRTRSLLNLAMLAAMARWHEFSVHTKGALNNG